MLFTNHAEMNKELLEKVEKKAQALKERGRKAEVPTIWLSIHEERPHRPGLPLEHCLDGAQQPSSKGKFHRKIKKTKKQKTAKRRVPKIPRVDHINVHTEEPG